MTKKPKYITISLPQPLVQQIDDFIEKHDGLYTNRTHVVKIAVNKLFKNYKKKEGMKKDERKNTKTI